MKPKVLASLAILVALTSLTVACSRSQTDTPKALQASDETLEDSNPPTETVPLPPAVDPQIEEYDRRLREAEVAVSSAGDPLPTHMNCELDTATAARISALETELTSMLTKYTDKHPDVISLRQTMRETKEEALSRCERCRFENERIRALEKQSAGVSDDQNPVARSLKQGLASAKEAALAVCVQ